MTSFIKYHLQRKNTVIRYIAYFLTLQAQDKFCIFVRIIHHSVRFFLVYLENCKTKKHIMTLINT